MKWLLVFLLTLASGAAFAQCPSVPSQCPNPTYNTVTLATPLAKVYGGTGNTTGAAVAGGSNGQVQVNSSGSLAGLTPTQLTAIINTFTSSLSGAVPLSGGGTANFLRADGTWASPPGSGAALNVANVWSAQQSGSITTLPISTATITPDGSNNDYSFTLSHSLCPCTLANPSVTPVPGTHGVIYVIQSTTGSDTIGTWGSDYYAPGGTASIVLSTGANARDVLSYAVESPAKIILSPIYNVTH